MIVVPALRPILDGFQIHSWLDVSFASREGADKPNENTSVCYKGNSMGWWILFWDVCDDEEYWKRPEEKEDDLNPTDDREASEEPHGASNKTQLGLRLDLPVPLDVVKGGRVKENLHQLEGWGR